MSEKIYANNSNSNRSKENKGDDKKVKTVVKSKVVQKKKSGLSKVVDSFITTETGSIKEYVIYDVIIPEVQNIISNVIKGSIDMLFHGEVRKNYGGRQGGYGNASRVSYADYYDRGRQNLSRRNNDYRRERSSIMSVDDIIFETRDDAEAVLDRMDELVDCYGVVSVADVFELSGVSGNGFTDRNYGWTNIRNADIERERGGSGYCLRLSRPTNIQA